MAERTSSNVLEILWDTSLDEYLAVARTNQRGVAIAANIAHRVAQVRHADSRV